MTSSTTPNTKELRSSDSASVSPRQEKDIYLEDELYNNSGINFTVGHDERENLVFIQDKYPDEFNEAMGSLTLYVQQLLSDIVDKVLDELESKAISRSASYIKPSSAEDILDTSYRKVIPLSAIEQVKKEFNDGKA